MTRIQSHEELDVHKMAFAAAMQIFEVTNYDHVIGKLVNMIFKPSPWILRSSKNEITERERS
jgi:hypothetical protein